MTHIPRALLAIKALLGGAPPPPPVEALAIERRGLVGILRRHCGELHEERQRVAGTPAEADVVRQIRYCEDVLLWVKSQNGNDLIVMNRKL